MGKIVDTAQDLRNDIAHPDANKDRVLPLGKSGLAQFLDWAIELRDDLRSVLEVSDRGYGNPKKPQERRS